MLPDQWAIQFLQLEKLYHERLLSNLAALQENWGIACISFSPLKNISCNHNLHAILFYPDSRSVCLFCVHLPSQCVLREPMERGEPREQFTCWDRRHQCETHGDPEPDLQDTSQVKHNNVWWSCSSELKQRYKGKESGFFKSRFIYDLPQQFLHRVWSETFCTFQNFSVIKHVHMPQLCELKQL